MKLKAAIGVFVGSLVTATSALAVGPAESVYGGEAGVAQSQVEPVSGVEAATATNALPFTGLDLILLVGGGALLLITGIVLYLISRPRTSA